MSTPILGSNDFTDVPTVQGVPLHLQTTNTVLSMISTNIAPSSGTTIIPYDATAPLSTEGTQLWTTTVTPTSATSKYLFSFSTFVSAGNSNRYITVALFRDTTCISVATQHAATSGAPYILTLTETDVADGTNPITYSLRIGASSTTTWYSGQTNTGRFAGVGTTNISITETI